jgi:hypothetical protein
MDSYQPKTIAQRISQERGCSVEEALDVLANELQSPSQRFWSILLFPWCGPLREHYKEVVKDISRIHDLNEVRNSIIYWRQRTPNAGFLGQQFRVHTSQAVRLSERLRKTDTVSAVPHSKTD